MKEFHKELLSEIINDWSIEQLETYITMLENRAVDLKEWISHLRTIRKKKVRKVSLDNGTRGGL